MRERQREAVKSFCQCFPVTVTGEPKKDTIRIMWTVGAFTYSLEGRGVSPDELLVKIPTVERKWMATEAEDRKNAGPETT